MKSNFFNIKLVDAHLKKKRQLSFFITLLLTFLNFSSFLMAQTFERIERVSKLDILEENNGVAVADYDGDHDLDLFVVAKAKDIDGNEKTHSRLFSNNNDGTFKDVTLESGLANLFPSNEPATEYEGLDGIKAGVAWGDYDNDGFPDIFFTHSYKVQLFHNEGDGTFKETTSESGILGRNECRNTGATWFDVNNDSFLDLYISEWGECKNNIFYINNGDGTFRDETERFGISTLKLSYMSIPFDFNEDGWMDLYVNQDTGGSNNLFINQNGTGFEDQADRYKLKNFNNNMGISINDYNRDGLFDIFITTIKKNVLFTNSTRGVYTNFANRKEVEDTGWAWDANFSDFDLDGDEDLFIVNGFKTASPQQEVNTYFENEAVNGFAGFRFTDTSEEVKLKDLTMSIGATPFDYDNDGDLDMFVTNNNKPSAFYENKTINEEEVFEDPHWFKLALEGTVSNRSAIGTIVKLRTEDNVLMRYYSGVGFLSQSLQPVHFGLGEKTEILEVEIKWPSGIVEIYKDLPIDTTILAIESNGYEIYEVSPVVKKKGCTDPTSCNFDPEALVNDGSCSYLDANQIDGVTEAGFLTEEIYTYEATSNGELYWKVSGGEIIEGHGTETIKVKWGLKKTGKISLRETNSECSSPLLEKIVYLSLTDKTKNNNSIARIWNEVLLDAIRGDYARPTIHARNLFHISVALYDTWALYNENVKTYLIGNTVHNFKSTFDTDVEIPNDNLLEDRARAMSYAAYRLLIHRFSNSPSSEESKEIFDLIMKELGYDILFDSKDYSKGNSAALGNFIAEEIIKYGLTDGSNESLGYKNSFYKPVNFALAPGISGNKDLSNPNRWQPLSLNEFIDQSGNLIEGSRPDFLSPEWGAVKSFSLSVDDRQIYERDRNSYHVYHDPESPPYLNMDKEDDMSKSYKWGFSMVSVWGAHLDPKDGVIWDISPKSIGNIDIAEIPTSFDKYPEFYDFLGGGDIGQGRNLNPITNTPYEEQNVPRGDYTRVLAEFWADGPDSETPPGHWFTILNHVSDNPLLEKKIAGQGEVVTSLEWDVKSYFILAGAMHDAAISAWGVKGWYDYIRPISAIRFMSGLGQSTDPTLDNYNVAGIPLEQGKVEIVQKGDPLVGEKEEHLGKIKVYTWRGHNYIEDVSKDVAGVDWILAENWWPYQRPSFVTPPFAGYVSGHSTYSRAAAEVMTLLTGSEFFPGGMGEFIARKNEFLVFEKGPSVDVKLQWATYRDASDQCSLSRIWGGIHPPADDLPGRLIGQKVGVDAFNFALQYFEKEVIVPEEPMQMQVYPNPVSSGELYISHTKQEDVIELIDLKGSKISFKSKVYDEIMKTTGLEFSKNLPPKLYVIRVNDTYKLLFIK